MKLSNETLEFYQSLPQDVIHRREMVYLILVGIFLAAMTLLNVIGLTRFISLGPLTVAVGVLPYPLTFLCTDLLSELYGRKRANMVVWMGLLINAMIVFVMWGGHIMPSADSIKQPPWQVLNVISGARGEPLVSPNGIPLSGEIELFTLIYLCTTGAVTASMFAYIAAQFCDVWLFHFWKRLTKGKHLWIRNNFSTLISQLVDSIAVIGITFGSTFFAGKMTLETLVILIGSNYAFKFLVAVMDTIPLYICVGYLTKALRINAETLVE